CRISRIRIADHDNAAVYRRQRHVDAQHAFHLPVGRAIGANPAAGAGVRPRNKAGQSQFLPEQVFLAIVSAIDDTIAVAIADLAVGNSHIGPPTADASYSSVTRIRGPEAGGVRAVAR